MKSLYLDMNAFNPITVNPADLTLPPSSVLGSMSEYSYPQDLDLGTGSSSPSSMSDGSTFCFDASSASSSNRSPFMGPANPSNEVEQLQPFDPQPPALPLPSNLAFLTMPHDIVAINKAMWAEAVQTRDPNFVGIFWYGVTSTKIYCRPTCPGRRPTAKNTVFFSSCQEAEQNGYRSCLRCLPKAVQDKAEARQSLAVDQVVKILRTAAANHRKAPTLDELAKDVRMSPFYLHRTFTKRFGCSPRAYFLRLVSPKAGK